MKRHFINQRIFPCLVMTSLGAFCYTTPALSVDKNPPASTQADNTRVNKRDIKASEKTSQDQGLSEHDTQTTLKIRRSLTDETNLSTYARNVKIITNNNVVTLKGPVKSDSERNKVIAIAKAVAGETNVKSELAIAK